MLLRKSMVSAFILAIMFIVNMPFASYGYVYNEYAGQPGVDSAENVGEANDTIGGRGANLGYITPAQHVVANTVVRAAIMSKKAERVSFGDLDPEADSELIAGIEKYSLTGFSIENLSVSTGGIAGHYGITRGAVYVDKAENEATKGALMKHELYELIKLLDWAEEQDLNREQLVEKLKEPDFAEEAKKMLKGFHDENPYDIGKGKDVAEPQHMDSVEVLGYRGLASASDATIGNIIVNNDAGIVLTKNSFFETHADDNRIITLPASVIIDGTVTPEVIAELINEQKVSVAILVADEAQYQAVRQKFDPQLLQALIDAVNLAFVQMPDAVLQVAVTLFNGSDGNLMNSSLTNLNKALIEAAGIQI